jgi:hypothetical protein
VVAAAFSRRVSSDSRLDSSPVRTLSKKPTCGESWVGGWVGGVVNVCVFEGGGACLCSVCG